MRIEKENIVIRSVIVDDAEQLNQWWNDGKVMELTFEDASINDIDNIFNLSKNLIENSDLDDRI
ncbi:hypothetical protein RBU61_09990 [Tissierella sp. MB52-C2]|uniref:hypothetical protein n=1 Tax=Tissierella sp. MB52-C2 TaxID=3070999 RepID=UPI00280A6F5E|nr:hypothetical protein [Tissierella sp. MB52-C2]WMM23286.1 hypothetical protein RBU61_09990 [Tissierella sp. MB52-C2]